MTHADYPTLVPADQPVETIGVGVTLAAFGWQPNAVRYRNLTYFVDQFFTKFPELLKPPHHPAWHNVNLTASVPGWVRFPPAETWLAAHRPGVVAAASDSKMQAQFDAYLSQHGITLTPAQRQATWAYFQQQHAQTQ